MYPFVTLEEMKSVILCNMGLGAVGTVLVRRVAYRLLNIFPPDQFKFKIFWVDSDEHVRALFDLHRRYETREVMELLTEMKSIPDVAGGSSSSNGVIPCLPIHCPAPEVPMLMDTNSRGDSDEDFMPNFKESSESSDGSEFIPESQSRRGFLLPAPSSIPDLSSVNSHFHTLHLDDMEEEPREGFGGVVTTMMEVRRFGGPHECLAPLMSFDHVQLDGRLICNVILPMINSNPSVRIPVLQAVVQQSYSFMPSYQKVWLAKQNSIAKLY
ncbi:hypothetical protein PIB30_017435 [Stylosanthes scabra]|uniref:Uncharacterized protein n=1 Tax=Stylosanthes scabra TaxID=79078 RepID=A0ABU6X6I0_9FABA|nr:hypothetical protein [Stylosanthes scabra]